MPGSKHRNIEVQPSTLPNLMHNVANGTYRIPQFQRDFVWSTRKIIELFDSIYHEFPIGSFFLWDAPQEHNQLFRQMEALCVPDVGEHDDVRFILDGQQRTVSLYCTLHGLQVNGTDYGRICFDLKEQKFCDRIADNKRYVRVCDIWGGNILKLSHQVDEEYVPALERCWQTLQTYPISLVEVRDKDLPAVSKIFRRINQSGKRLSRFDLVAAMTYTPDFDLRRRFEVDIAQPLKTSNFGEIAPSIATSVVALLVSGRCHEKDLYDLTTAQIKAKWEETATGILLAADTLRSSMGVVNSAYLPYEAFLTLLGYYYAKSGRRSLPAKHLDWVKRWFWQATFSEHYGGAAPSVMARDRELFDGLIAGQDVSFDRPVQLGVADLVRTRMTWTGAAIRNGLLCLLASRQPLHLANNSPLDLVNGGITGFTNNEHHHVFPVSFLKRSGATTADVHALPNFCFLPAELNKWIRDKDPATYFSELQEQNPDFETAARSHLLPLGQGCGIPENDYLAFLEARGQLLVEEIERLCGGITAPPPEERQAAIKKLEDRIRDCIHSVLLGLAGPHYWDSNVPPAIRERADERVKQALVRDPDLSPDAFSSPRKRLDYVSTMEYLPIIEDRANWDHFRPVFRSVQDLETHLQQLSEFRNCVMHGRDMTPYIQKAGELALIWFENVLAEDTDPDEPTGVEDGEEGEGDE